MKDEVFDMIKRIIFINKSKPYSLVKSILIPINVPDCL